MQLIDADATRAALPLPALIDALERMHREGCDVPPRQMLAVGSGADAATLLVMPAWQSGGLLGVKTVHVAPANAARGLPALHASYLLSDAATGVPLALLDGGELTARRTAAVAALAARRLAPPGARRLLVVGAGRVAALLAPAYLAVRPIDTVRVWARRPAAAEALAASWRAEGLSAAPAADLDAALADADIVASATLAESPLVTGRRLAPGSHLALIGSFTPTMREADDDALRGAAIYVDSEEALAKSGDLATPLAAGVIARGAVRGTLADLCRGTAPLPDPGERTVFKSVGNALQDLAAARLVHDGRRG